MTPRLCDRCGQIIDEGVLRYVAKIQVYAAYDPLAITFDDMTRDHADEIKEILKRCEGLDKDELMRDVYIDFHFDLCRSCQRAYTKDPLPSVSDS